MLCHCKPLQAELAVCAQDEENLKRAHNEVPTEDELNCRLARSPAELATFRAIDAEMDSVSNPMGEPCLKFLAIPSLHHTNRRASVPCVKTPRQGYFIGCLQSGLQFCGASTPLCYKCKAFMLVCLCVVSVLTVTDMANVHKGLQTFVLSH